VTGTKGSRTTREAILDATDRLLARVGFRRMTMEDVAREAGLSRRAVYTYFATKAELGLSSIDRVIEQTHERMRAIAAEGGDPRRRLRGMLIERVLYRIDTVREYRRSLDELFEAVRPAYMERRQRHFAKEAEMLAVVLEDGRAAGCFAFDDANATAMMLVLATNAFLPYNLSVEELGRREQVAADVARMADLMLAGLSAPPQPPARRRG
jgi:AcrR family transcriptional regulator